MDLIIASDDPVSRMVYRVAVEQMERQHGRVVTGRILQTPKDGLEDALAKSGSPFVLYEIRTGHRDFMLREATLLAELDLVHVLFDRYKAPFVILSGTPEMTRQLAEEAGACGYIVPPINDYGALAALIREKSRY